MNWASSVNSFLSSSLGGEVSKILTGVAIVGIIVGIVHSAWKNHNSLGKMLRRDIEVIVVGVIVAVPAAWGPICAFVAKLVGAIFSWAAGL